MWLLETTQLRLQYFVPTRAPDYVILSHRWLDDQDELTFSEVSQSRALESRKNSSRADAGFAKVWNACDLARSHGYSWIWIDSCCINRSSSSELQEDINSMWTYYNKANICYVYLADVSNDISGWNMSFRVSSWWSRGWTLQELLAPESVEFYAADWTPIGTKAERYIEIADITSISREALSSKAAMGKFSAAEKFSWAAHREVTRPEDEAYSMLGIFRVNMSLLYGEGPVNAFFRLQQAVFAATGDCSLFLFRYSSFPGEQPLLADCPTRFCPSPDCNKCRTGTTVCLQPHVRYSDLAIGAGWLTQAHETLYAAVTDTNHVFSTTLQLLSYSRVSAVVDFGSDSEIQSSLQASHVAVLNFTLRGTENSVLCLPLQRSERYGLDNFLRLPFWPALVPWNYAKSRQSRKAIICPDIRNADADTNMVVTFVMAGQDFERVEWLSPHTRSRLSEMEDDSWHSYSIQTTKYPVDETSHVSCNITLSMTPPQTIDLRLQPLDYVWSIERVSDMTGKILFESPAFSDRFKLRLSDGKFLTVGLRRLPALYRTQNGAGTRLCYQIGVNIVDGR